MLSTHGISDNSIPLSSLPSFIYSYFHFMFDSIDRSRSSFSASASDCKVHPLLWVNRDFGGSKWWLFFKLSLSENSPDSESLFMLPNFILICSTLIGDEKPSLSVLDVCWTSLYSRWANLSSVSSYDLINICDYFASLRNDLRGLTQNGLMLVYCI